MAAIAGELTKQIKGHSEGAQGFRPWWDTVEDNLMYAFVVLGMVSLPMTFFSKTPIECTPHHNNWPNVTEVPGLSRFFPKVYCTEMMIEPFLLYLPFTLLMVPIILICIEKTYVVLYQVEEKMNQFYHLLVKESLNNEDVANLAKDNVKDCHEIEQAFKFSNDCYTSYYYRTLLEIIGSILLAVMFGFYYNSNGIGVPFFDCEVYGYLFECIVPNSQFFLYIYVASFVLIGGYLACSIYNFLWIISPKVGTLSRFLDGCSRQRDSYTEKIQPVKQGPPIRLKLYFQPGAHDFSMLLNLLAESQGLPEAFRILSLFEHQFAMLWEPTNIRLLQRRNSMSDLSKATDEKDIEPLKKPQSLIVSWDDAEIADYFHKAKFYRVFRSRYTFEYTVEINPPTEAPIKGIIYYQDSSWRQCEALEMLGGTSFTQNEKKPTFEQARKYSLSFDGLEPEQKYKIIFSTEINGRTIMQTIRNFECMET